MTEFEQFFLDTTDWLDQNGFKYMLHGSTLLRIVRNNTVEPREDLVFDRELNFAMLAENFTDDHYRKLSSSPYFEPVNSRLPNCLIFYGPYPKVPYAPDHWSIRPGFTLIARFWKGKTKRVEYMGGDHCLVFPKELFEKPSKIEFMGKTFLTPKGPHDYLSYYFGPDYMTENRGWHWSQAESQKLFSDISDDLC